MDLLIKGGTVVTASESYIADVAVSNGKIAAIGKDLNMPAERVVNAAGMLVLPGALDVHTHMAMPFGGTVSADSYLSGTRAAVCGGVTTIFDYPVQHTGETILGLINSKKDVLEKEACCDYAFHCCITDHCPFQSYEKDWGKDDFSKIPNGCAGVENLYPYMLDAANAGKLSFEKVVEVCAANPARIFGCQNKGAIAIGKDADIVLYDREKDFTISVNTMHSDYDHTIWEGKKLHGYPVQTYLRGQLVYDNGDFVETPGTGAYVKRTPKS